MSDHSGWRRSPAAADAKRAGRRHRDVRRRQRCGASTTHCFVFADAGLRGQRRFDSHINERHLGISGRCLRRRRERLDHGRRGISNSYPGQNGLYEIRPLPLADAAGLT